MVRLLGLAALTLFGGCLKKFPDHCSKVANCSVDGGTGGGDAGLRYEIEGEPKVAVSPIKATIVGRPPVIQLKPGGTYTFKGSMDCPAAYAPCTPSWDFGDGQTSTQLEPGVITFAKAGFFWARFSATSAQGLKITDRVRVIVWTGTFTDDFNRTAMEWQQSGWTLPILVAEELKWEITNNQLRMLGDLGFPGSTAATTWHVNKDVRVEVSVKRSQVLTVEHFSDIIVRMDPTKLAGSFYRMRLQEAVAPDNGIEIAIFKILKPNDEHGILLNDPNQPPTANPPPTQCVNCPYLGNYPRSQDLRMILELKGNTFTTSLVDPKNPNVPLLTSVCTDPLAPTHGAGYVGITHFEGMTLFDDFVLKSLDP